MPWQASGQRAAHFGQQLGETTRRTGRGQGPSYKAAADFGFCRRRLGGDKRCAGSHLAKHRVVPVAAKGTPTKGRVWLVGRVQPAVAEQVASTRGAFWGGA